MFGARAPGVGGATRVRVVLLGPDSESVAASASSPIAVPAAISPPATSPRLRNVRRSTLLSLSGSMLAMRALILGPAVTLALVPAPASVAAPRAAPTCTPVTADNSAVLAGSVTVSPIPGSRDASPHTQISFLGVPARALGGIDVRGSRTGFHAGRLLAYSQGDGASFVPARPFAEGERVSVRARVRAPGASGVVEDAFAVAGRDPLTTTPETIHPGRAGEAQAFRSRPDLHPPAV